MYVSHVTRQSLQSPLWSPFLYLRPLLQFYFLPPPNCLSAQLDSLRSVMFIDYLLTVFSLRFCRTNIALL